MADRTSSDNADTVASPSEGPAVGEAKSLGDKPVAELTEEDKMGLLRKAFKDADDMFPGDGTMNKLMRNQLKSAQGKIVKQLMDDPTGSTLKTSLLGGGGFSADWYFFGILAILVCIILQYYKGIEVDSILSAFLFWSLEPQIPDDVLRQSIPWVARLEEYPRLTCGLDLTVHYARSKRRLEKLNKELLEVYRHSPYWYKKGFDYLLQHPERIYTAQRTAVTYLGGEHYSSNVFWSSFGGGSVLNEDYAIKVHLEHSFGSAEDFRKDLLYLLTEHWGNGWCWLQLNTTSGDLSISLHRYNTGPFLEEGLVGLLAIDLSRLPYFPASKRNYLNSLLKDINWEVVERRYVNSFPDFEMKLGSGKCASTDSTKALESEEKAYVSIPWAQRNANFEELRRSDDLEVFVRNLKHQRAIWMEEAAGLNRLLNANPPRVNRMLEALDELAARLLGEEDGEISPEDTNWQNMIYLGQRFLLHKKFFASLTSEPSPPTGEFADVLRKTYEKGKLYAKASDIYYGASGFGFFAMCWDCSTIHLIQRIPLEEPQVPGCVDILAIPLGEEVSLGLSVAEGERNRASFFRNVWRAVSWQKVGEWFNSIQCLN